MRTRVVLGIVGFLFPLLVVGWYGAVLSLIQPVDWATAVSIALWFCPITAAAGATYPSSQKPPR